MRSRNIKPGFFRNDILASCDPICRLLFIGLWCAADREGRIEKRPQRIKAEIFPYDSLDINRELTVLERRGFIQTYKVEGNEYIHIVHFKDHQNPHHTEAKSKLPAITDGCIVPVGSPLNTGEYPADSLIPDSLIQKSKEGDKSPETLIWNIGLKILTDAGTTEKNARNFLGKHVKLNKEKLAEVISLMAVHPPVEPIAYIEKALQPKRREVVL